MNIHHLINHNSGFLLEKFIMLQQKTLNLLKKEVILKKIIRLFVFF